MSVATSTRTLFPLEQRTWVSILTIGVGFGVVATVALILAGAHERGVIALATPLVFGYTAATIHRPLDRPQVAFRAPVARVLNWVLVGLATATIAYDVAPVVRDGLDGAHPAVLLVTIMTVVLQLAVVVMAHESLRRL